MNVLMLVMVAIAAVCFTIAGIEGWRLWTTPAGQLAQFEADLDAAASPHNLPGPAQNAAANLQSNAVAGEPHLEIHHPRHERLANPRDILDAESPEFWTRMRVLRDEGYELWAAAVARLEATDWVELARTGATP